MTLTYEEALDTILNFDDPYQRAIRDHGKQTWGLRGMRALLEKIGNPHLAYPTIHVAGTKGKGSTSAFIAQGLIESGLKTGLYTSPPLQDWRERIQLNRELIPGEALAELVEELLPYVEDISITAFEAATVLAFMYFAKEECDAAVIEVGLGGRLDATSVVQPLVAVITSISYDHMQLLGSTLPEIAYEKAAIIKPETPVVSAPQEPAAERVVREIARKQDAPLTMVGKDWRYKPLELDWHGSLVEMGISDNYKMPVEVGLPGVFQVENAAVALAALNIAEQQGLAVTRQGRIVGLEKARWPGRLELVQYDPHVIIDGAHNADSIQKLTASLRALSTPEQARGRRVFVFGCMADKDIDAMLRTLLNNASRIVLTSAEVGRAAEVDELVERAGAIQKELHHHTELDTAPTTAEAVRKGLEGLQENDLLCITGSLSIAGEARDELVGKPVRRA